MQTKRMKSACAMGDVLLLDWLAGLGFSLATHNARELLRSAMDWDQPEPLAWLIRMGIDRAEFTTHGLIWAHTAAMDRRAQVLQWMDKEFDLLKQKGVEGVLIRAIERDSENTMFGWTTKKLEEMTVERIFKYGTRFLCAMLEWNCKYLGVMKKIGITALHCIQVGGVQEAFLRSHYELLDWIFENEKKETLCEIQRAVNELLPIALIHGDIRLLNWLKKIGVTPDCCCLQPWVLNHIRQNNIANSEQWLRDMGHPL